MQLQVIIALIISLVGVSVTLMSAWSRAEKQVGELYDQMVRYRTKYPEVMFFSRQWKEDYFKNIYYQKSEDDKKWVIYYSYVELCLGYCNTVLLLRWSLRPGSYRHQHKELIKLILTEHYPIIKDLLKGPYISTLIKKFIEKQEDWNWKDEYRKLAE